MQDRKFETGESKMTIADNDELVRRFSDWEPRVRKIVDLAGRVRYSLLENHSTYQLYLFE